MFEQLFSIELLNLGSTPTACNHCCFSTQQVHGVWPAVKFMSRLLWHLREESRESCPRKDIRQGLSTPRNLCKSTHQPFSSAEEEKTVEPRIRAKGAKTACGPRNCLVAYIVSTLPRVWCSHLAKTKCAYCAMVCPTLRQRRTKVL